MDTARGFGRAVAAADVSSRSRTEIGAADESAAGASPDVGYGAATRRMPVTPKTARRRKPGIVVLEGRRLSRGASPMMTAARHARRHRDSMEVPPEHQRSFIPHFAFSMKRAEPYLRAE